MVVVVVVGAGAGAGACAGVLVVSVVGGIGTLISTL